MTGCDGSKRSQTPSRRQFLKNGATAVLAGGLMSRLSPAVYAGGSDVLRIGLIGCGGRGTGAAKDALNADKNVQLVAMGDVFADQVKSSYENLQKALGDRVNGTPPEQFVGFDAYKQVIEASDVVLLATPPHFRPAHLRAAVEAGKHIFCEKPVAVDAPGARSVFETTKLADEKKLAIVSGLCWRYHHVLRATFDQVLSGAIGDILAMQCSYNTQGLWKKPRQPEWSDMEWQVRNWLYFTWLSGDFITEQHVHSLDKMTWAMQGEAPVKASGTGGRQVRTSPDYGHVYDHFAIEYEYANGVKAFSRCRQQDGCQGDITDHLFGTKGTCDIASHRTKISGETKWKYKAPEGAKAINMYQFEHEELFRSIRAGEPINNGHYMTVSTMMAVMGRMAAYTGKTITWDQAIHSAEDLTPPAYEWGSLAMPSVAMPGVTPFV